MSAGIASSRLIQRVLCIGILAVMPATTMAAPRPNVVMLLADDLGWKDIGCYGGPVKTPTLDKLAAGGMRFTDYYAGASVCSPSRATMLTGRHHMRAGVYSWIADYAQNAHLLEREITLAEVLQDNGYGTAHFGKWHLGLSSGKRKKPDISDHGFDYWFGTENGPGGSHHNPTGFLRNGKRVGPLKGYSCQLVVDDAINWLDTRENQDKPFFLNIWFHEPHAPLAAPDKLISPYGELKNPGALYSGTIDNTDRAIAKLIAKLKEMGVTNDTLIIYSSDNGSYRPDRVGHLRGTKGSNYEGGLRVPGIFYWPGVITKGHVEQEPAGLVDLLPTVCGLLGIDKPAGIHLDGSDISPVLTGRKRSFTRQEPLAFLRPTAGPAAMIREGNYTLLAHRDGGFKRDEAGKAKIMKQVEAILRADGSYEQEIRGSTLAKKMFENFKNPEANRLRGQYVRLNMFQEAWIPAIKAGGYKWFELYDLYLDPSQKNNIAAKHPRVVARLKKQLLDINASVIKDAPDWHLTDREFDYPHQGSRAN